MWKQYQTGPELKFNGGVSLKAVVHNVVLKGLLIDSQYRESSSDSGDNQSAPTPTIYPIPNTDIALHFEKFGNQLNSDVGFLLLDSEMLLENLVKSHGADALIPSGYFFMQQNGLKYSLVADTFASEGNSTYSIRDKLVSRTNVNMHFTYGFVLGATKGFHIWYWTMVQPAIYYDTEMTVWYTSRVLTEVATGKLERVEVHETF